MTDRPPPKDPPPPLSPLPPLRDVIQRHGLGARKALGQNFLLDGNLTGRIARSASDLRSCTVIEIGPGPGGLTRSLLAAGAGRVVAVERDERCVRALAELQAAYPGRLTIIEGDALAVDAAALAPAPRAVVANLPYNIATPLLFGWLADIGAFTQLVLLFQKEVAERITAPPGDRHFGRLAVAAQWRARAERLFDIGPKAFVPPPKVTSTLVRLVPRSAPLAPADPDLLSRVTAAAFGQRRKMLRSSLRVLGTALAEAMLRTTGIDGTRRAEELTIEEFCALARALAAESSEGALPG